MLNSMQVISLGKKGDISAQNRASSFLLNQSLLPIVFDTFAKRYAARPGGYTRIHRFGNRQGDNAPHAILELVDSPKDLRWEITSRAAGREILRNQLQKQTPLSIINSQPNTLAIVQEAASEHATLTSSGIFRPKTRWNIQKLLKYRDGSALSEFSSTTNKYMVGESCRETMNEV